MKSFEFLKFYYENEILRIIGWEELFVELRIYFYVI